MQEFSVVAYSSLTGKKTLVTAPFPHIRPLSLLHTKSIFLLSRYNHLSLHLAVYSSNSSTYEGHPMTGLDICTGRRWLQPVGYADVEEVGEENNNNNRNITLNTESTAV